MSLKVSSTATTIIEPPYYHREYKNDVPQQCGQNEENSWATTAQRAAFTALPFFSLYKPFSFPLSLAMGGLRTYTSVAQLLEVIKSGDSKAVHFAMLQTAVAVIALAGTVFAHPLGMLISTSHDLMLEVIQLVENLKNEEYEKAAINCFNIINNALYLALFLHGGLELAIASLALQILLGLYNSRAEFLKENYIEAIGHLGMSLARGNQLVGQAKILHSRHTFRKEVRTNLGGVEGSEVIKKAVYETYNVSIVRYNGYIYHIADYRDGTRVITCLDGSMRGYQGVAYEGRQVAESFNVQWYKDHFVHHYSNGRIYSYDNWQRAEFF